MIIQLRYQSHTSRMEDWGLQMQLGACNRHKHLQYKITLQILSDSFSILKSIPFWESNLYKFRK